MRSTSSAWLTSTARACNQDAGKLEEVSDLLGELREAWAQVADEIARA